MFLANTDYPQSTADRREIPYHLAIRYYISHDRPDPAPQNAVAIIGLHGTLGRHLHQVEARRDFSAGHIQPGCRRDS